MKRPQKDPRINVGSFSWKRFWLQFLCIMAVCGFFLVIYTLQPHTHENGHYLALSLLAYLIVISLLLSLVLTIFRRHVISDPLDVLQEAARRVAQGDLTVRIPPQRTDGKKDEFEVMYEDFNTMVAELASTELLKKDFVSNVSHELKTPLSVIQSYASILQSEHLTEAERRDYSERICTAATRLSTLVSNILLLSRLENQKLAAHSSTFNLSEQLCRCILGFEQLLDEKELALTVDLDQNIQLCSDEGLLDIVWNNLLSNALKFTDAHGTVRIVACETPDAVTVSITDSGCGIDEKALHHIFDKFYQADGSHATQGNGLGLAMVSQVVAMLHGTVRVESTAGVGSTFTVTLQK